MPKSRSPATRAWAGRLGMPVIDRWPPPGRFPWQERPPGHVLWPKHLKNVPVKQNREHLAGIFRAAMARQLQQGRSLTFADDAHVLVLLGLNDMFEELLTTGAEGGAGLWLASQKTSGTLQGALTTFAYNQPAHIILGHEPIGENRKRFNDIGGIDAGLVANVVAGLRKHRIQTPHGAKNISEKLYIRKDGPYMCIVGI